MTHPAWPLFDLRLRTANLELRLPTDDDLVALIGGANAGIHPPEEMPFAVNWTDQPSPDFDRSFFQFHIGLRASWRPDDWSLPGCRAAPDPSALPRESRGSVAA